MSENSAKGLSRFAMEIGVALLTGAFGAAVCYGSVEAGTGWTDMGPRMLAISPSISAF